MRAAVLTEPGRIVVEDRAAPTPAPHEVVVDVRSVGVCGSDTHYFDHGRIGRFVVERPLVLGHEAAGVVVGVGSAVDPGRLGQRVSIEPGVPCMACSICLRGAYNLCPDMRFYATPPVDGAFAEQVTIHGAFAHPVPDTLTDAAAALLEPLSVGVWSARKAAVGPGSRVLITGAGAIGLVAAQVALACGATDVTVSDVNAARLALALELGATRTVDAAEGVDALGADVLIECSGHPAATVQGLRALAPGGRAVLVGMGGDELALPLSLVQERELVVTGTFRYANTWPTAIALADSGRVRLDPLVTSRFGLDEVSAALTAARVIPGTVKALVEPQR